MRISLTEAQLRRVVLTFEKLKGQNLNHSPKCPYVFDVSGTQCPGGTMDAGAERARSNCGPAVPIGMRCNLRDWDLRRFSLFKGVEELRETELGYLLRLNYSYQYRRFLLHDNGGELNFEEIGRTNRHFKERSMHLPLSGSYAETNEAVVYYRIMQFIANRPIDYGHRDDTLTDADYAALLDCER